MAVNFVATWRPDAEKFYQGKADAQKVAEEIYAIGENPTAKQIVDMARDTSTATNKLIEWDDSVAAEKYRLRQAAHIVADIQIVKIESPKAPQQSTQITFPVRMFHHLEGEEGYRPLNLIVDSNDLYNRLLETAISELKSFKMKYGNLKELANIFDLIQEL